MKNLMYINFQTYALTPQIVGVEGYEETGNLFYIKL